MLYIAGFEVNWVKSSWVWSDDSSLQNDSLQRVDPHDCRWVIVQKAKGGVTIVRGSAIHRSGVCEFDVEARVRAAWGNVFRHQKLLMAKCVLLEKRIWFLQNSTIQCLAYGAGTWNLSKKLMMCLVSTHLDMVRKMMVVSRPADLDWVQYCVGVGRFARKKTVDSGCEFASDVAMSRKCTWAGHVTRCSTRGIHRRITFWMNFEASCSRAFQHQVCGHSRYVCGGIIRSKEMILCVIACSDSVCSLCDCCRIMLSVVLMIVVFVLIA